MLKDKFVAFVKNPQTIEIAKTVASTVVTLVVINVVAVVVSKAVEAGVEKLTNSNPQQEIPAE